MTLFERMELSVTLFLWMKIVKTDEEPMNRALQLNSPMYCTKERSQDLPYQEDGLIHCIYTM